MLIWHMYITFCFNKRFYTIWLTFLNRSTRPTRENTWKNHRYRLSTPKRGKCLDFVLHKVISQGPPSSWETPVASSKRLCGSSEHLIHQGDHIWPFILIHDRRLLSLDYLIKANCRLSIINISTIYQPYIQYPTIIIRNLCSKQQLAHDGHLQNQESKFQLHSRISDALWLFNRWFVMVK